MVSEFPSNSRSQNIVVDKPEAKKVERVTTSDAVRRKKPLGKRIAETFTGGDNMKSVFGFITLDVLLPAAKDAVADAVSQGVERMIFGEARSTSRRTGQRPGGSNGRVNYSGFSRGNNNNNGFRDEPRNQMSRRARATHDFDEIIMPTRVEAEEVLDGLFELVSKYDMATVAELYSLCGITGDFTDEKWGWTNLRGAGASRVRGGYLLDLPKPEVLRD